MFSALDFLKTLQQTRFDQIGFVKFTFQTLPLYTRDALLFSAEEWFLALDYMLGKSRFCNLRVSLKKVLFAALQHRWLHSAPNFKERHPRLKAFAGQRFQMLLDKDRDYGEEIQRQQILFNEIKRVHRLYPFGDIQALLKLASPLTFLGLAKPDDSPPSPPPALETPPFQISETGSLGEAEQKCERQEEEHPGPPCCSCSLPSSLFPLDRPYQVVNVARLWFELAERRTAEEEEREWEEKEAPLEKAVDSLGLHRRRIRLPFEMERMESSI